MSDPLSEALTGMMLAHFKTADAESQGHILHGHIEQLHAMCAAAEPGVCTELGVSIMHTVSSVAKLPGLELCEDCSKSARCISEYLEVMDGHRARHDEARRIKEAIEGD